jgi:catechol 2,3-dioxygenase-like lactoylglutathione lyase family enzyme
MQVKGLDHVNIIAADLDETARFYEDLLGFRYGARPSEMNFPGGWLYDSEDRPIIHVMGYMPDRHGEQERKAMPTGSIDHVALACEDFAGTLRRCEELGIPHQVNDRKYGDLRQVFVTDPNNISLELNFAGD